MQGLRRRIGDAGLDFRGTRGLPILWQRFDEKRIFHVCRVHVGGLFERGLCGWKLWTARFVVCERQLSLLTCGHLFDRAICQKGRSPFYLGYPFRSYASAHRGGCSQFTIGICARFWVDNERKIAYHLPPPCFPRGKKQVGKNGQIFGKSLRAYRVAQPLSVSNRTGRFIGSLSDLFWNFFPVPGVEKTLWEKRVCL